jgi:hypothetical protein
MENEFIETLLRDMIEETRAAVHAESQYQRRSSIRSGFAAVEGWIAFMKTVILDDLHLNDDLHSPAEVALLREESYELRETGELRVSRKFIPTDANLRFTIKMWCKGTNDGKLDLSGNGWQAFKASLALRNRLAHPKNMGDLTVSDVDLRTFVEGMQWFLSTIVEKTVEVLNTARVPPSDMVVE